MASQCPADGPEALTALLRRRSLREGCESDVIDRLRSHHCPQSGSRKDGASEHGRTRSGIVSSDPSPQLSAFPLCTGRHLTKIVPWIWIGLFYIPSRQRERCNRNDCFIEFMVRLIGATARGDSAEASARL